MQPALLPEGFLQAAVQLVEAQLRLGAQVQHPAAEVLQLHREGHGHGRVAVQLGEPAEDLRRGRHLGRAAQHQEAQGDVQLGGGLPVRSRGGEEGGELLLQLVEAGQDRRSVGPEGDEVSGFFLRRTPVTFLFCLLRCRILRRSIEVEININSNCDDVRQKKGFHPHLCVFVTFQGFLPVFKMLLLSFLTYILVIFLK